MANDTTRYTYHHIHPRGFVNECHMVRCSTDDERLAAEAEGFTRLTRADAIAHLRYINYENDAWGSNRAFGRMRLADIPTWAEVETYA